MFFLDIFQDRFSYVAAAILMSIGLYAVIIKKNLLKKVIGLTIFQTSIILFYIVAGFRKGADIPILDPYAINEVGVDPSTIHNPVPQVLMLTAIVVGVAISGVALSLLQNIDEEFGTIEESEILKEMNSES